MNGDVAPLALAAIVTILLLLGLVARKVAAAEPEDFEPCGDVAHLPRELCAGTCSSTEGGVQ